MVTAISEKDYEKVVEQAKGPVLIDVWADWCQPCHMISPLVEKLSEELGDEARFVKLNADENFDLTGRLGVHSLPTLRVMKAGKVVREFIGVSDLAQMEQDIKAALKEA